MGQTEKSMIGSLVKRGWKGCITPITHIEELREANLSLRKLGLFDEEFYLERLVGFNFELPSSSPKAKSLIVVAVPRPQSQITLSWKGTSIVLPIPPTYVAYDETREQVEALLAKTLKADGYAVSPARLPLKLLAVRSGLGLYGRNNICYVPGMGSFLQLVAVYSDLPAARDPWRAPQTMERCQQCEACRLSCPTRAIPADRFLLRAERCLVFHNERKGDIPFPDWIDSSWHNCVVGCMHCQRVCPENKDFAHWVGEKKAFSEEETALLLANVPRTQLPTKTAEKLGKLNLLDYLENLPRNLSVFFTK
jgi:epoxyqueuosine reductase